jgi:DNA-binding MarR family transcriptional regulator
MGSHASDLGLLSLTHLPDDVRGAVDALRRIVRALRLTAHSAQTAGLSAAQLFVLQRLHEGPARSIAELAERTITDPSSVSVVVSKLVERRLVARSRSQDDARKAEIALTAAGRALLRKAPRPAQVSLIEAVAALPGLERRALARALGQLATAMGADQEPPQLFFEDESAAPRKRAPRRKHRG